ncbi:MAG TPA: methylated-DNA--[protein]-cysteine S-methyltransferase [Candidatus Eisenbacteria bacterium]|nr:methylated-DNA--[protein]-cysteine S-methyltransferase [Candidatus Eisenbacteria bacterium]
MKGPRVELAVVSVDTPAGPLWILCTKEGVRELRLGGAGAPTSKEGRARGISFVRRPAWSDGPEKALKRYLASRAPLDDVPLDVEAGTDFQRRVWEATRRIPLGSVWSYGKLARALGSPGASRAVGNALGANPAPLLIPCHRVIQSDRSIGGFSGGLAWKRFLLEHERGQLELGMPLPARGKRSRR